MQLIIGNKNYSSWSLRPWLVLKQFAVPFEETVIPLFRPESKDRILSYSPGGKVPVLRDGSVVVWESLAICEYLADRFPERNFWPQDPAARALARSLSAEMHAGFANVRSEMPMNVRRAPASLALSESARTEVARIQEIWRECRKGRSAGEFLFGAFTIADAMFAPVAYRFDRYGVAVDASSRAYMESLFSLPAMREWEDAARQEPWIIAVNEK